MAAHDWLPVTLVSAATLGSAWARASCSPASRALDVPTATLGMIAGGASGIVTMADDLGGDDRLVAFMQYLRVLVVVLLTPLLIAALRRRRTRAAAPGRRGRARRRASDWLLTARHRRRRARWSPAGARAGRHAARADARRGRADARRRRVRRPARAARAGVRADRPAGRPALHARHRPAARRACSSRCSARSSALLVGCAGLAVVLHADAPTSRFRDAYLATTPGGLYAVLAVAFGAGANTTFILAVQILRLLVAVLLAPLAVRRIARPGRQAG